jgi:hypothetical protein
VDAWAGPRAHQVLVLVGFPLGVRDRHMAHLGRGGPHLVKGGGRRPWTRVIRAQSGPACRPVAQWSGGHTDAALAGSLDDRPSERSESKGVTDHA